MDVGGYRYLLNTRNVSMSSQLWVALVAEKDGRM